mmetsp:Transcript_25700/g.56308  ORF Transcript_25700/g.56308 Transcript_25700/m.56308 type:complete len:231 (-) Transcript_25700:172-864(-)
MLLTLVGIAADIFRLGDIRQRRGSAAIAFMTIIVASKLTRPKQTATLQVLTGGRRSVGRLGLVLLLLPLIWIDRCQYTCALVGDRCRAGSNGGICCSSPRCCGSSGKRGGVGFHTSTCAGTGTILLVVLLLPGLVMNGWSVGHILLRLRLGRSNADPTSYSSSCGRSRPHAVKRPIARRTANDDAKTSAADTTGLLAVEWSPLRCCCRSGCRWDSNVRRSSCPCSGNCCG